MQTSSDFCHPVYPIILPILLLTIADEIGRMNRCRPAATSAILYIL